MRSKTLFPTNNQNTTAKSNEVNYNFNGEAVIEIKKLLDSIRSVKNNKM